MTDTVYWIWLASRLGAASRRLPYLLDRYSSPYDIYRAEDEELERLDLSPRLINGLRNKDMKEAYAILDYCASHNIGILTYSGEFYPDKLRSIADPPAVLYFKGKLPNTNDFVSIAMVGTRKMSEYGKRSAYKIAYELASAGVTVVSGMALGIDSVAACGAICGGGKTIAVLGSGVDVVYPKQHAKLYDIIIENGAVISEYPPTARPEAKHFPQRNRIISGLSNGTLIVECAAKSGALITAERAIEQGKDVFALPGNLDNKNSAGTNRLIGDGATIITCTEDILRSYEFYYGKKINFLGLNDAKSRSDIDENALKRMDICFRKDPEAENTKDPERKNLLRPRKLPKNQNDAGMPSTLEKKDQKDIENSRKLQRPTESQLEELDKSERDILFAMPDDRAIGVDALVRLGYSCSDVMCALVMLEIKGLVSSLPGGLYIKT
ncbi:MAG: DNA-processing protein DprA [Clostridia bacterium]|nr:DNA-processing protein DprA [Clostridia bacterium]